MTETLISIENLHKYFGKNEVLKGIDLDIYKGEVVVIIGTFWIREVNFSKNHELTGNPNQG